MTADERLALIGLKVERANKHISDLNAAVRCFLDSNPYKIVTKRDPQTRKLIYYLASAETAPSDFSTISGDVLNNLRSTLDHLAQQLYLVGTGGTSYRDKTSFLIAPSPKEFKAGLQRKVEGMRQDAIDAIIALEPYIGGQGTDLWTLHRLNNIDKHRLVVTVGSCLVGVAPVLPRFFVDKLPQGMAFPQFFITPADNLFPLKAGDELFIDAPDTDEDTQFGFQIAINEPGIIEGKPLMETLVQFSNRVSGIIKAFRPCLS